MYYFTYFFVFLLLLNTQITETIEESTWTYRTVVTFFLLFSFSFFLCGDGSNKSRNIEWNLWNFYECSIEISILCIILIVLKDNSLDRE